MSNLNGALGPVRVHLKAGPRLLFFASGPFTAALFAALVFLILMRRDQAPRAISSELQARPVSLVTQASTPAALISANVPALAPAGVTPHPLSFLLNRSRTFRDVGPVRLRLIRVNLRRHLCEISTRGRHRIHSVRLKLNQSTPIESEDNRSFRLVIQTISKETVSGVIEERT